MFRASETACDLFRRLHFPSLELVVDRARAKQKTESIPFGSCQEVLIKAKDVSEAVLDTIFQYLDAVPTGAIVHISIGNSLSMSLLQSKLDIANTPFGSAARDGRLKAVSVPTMAALIDVFSCLLESLQSTPCLVILEGLTPLIIAQKGTSSNLSTHSLLRKMFHLMEELQQSQHVMIMWFNIEVPKSSLGGCFNVAATGIRNSHSSDPVVQLWRQYIPRVIRFNFATT